MRKTFAITDEDGKRWLLDTKGTPIRDTVIGEWVDSKAISFDYLPENFEDEIEFEVDDPELIEKLVDFVGNIDFCGVSDLVNDLLDEINELTEKYSVEAISFLSKELDSRGYFVE